MANAEEIKSMEMVRDHEKRIKALEAGMADFLDAREAEAEIEKKHPQMTPGKGSDKK